MTRQDRPSAARGAARNSTYGGRSHEERAADRRSRLKDAALELFAARPFDEVTVADVCSRARVSKRHFYEEFDDRRDLMRCLHRELIDWLFEGIHRGAPENPDGLEELFRGMMSAWVGLLREHPDRARVIYINAPRMEMRRRGLMRRTAELFGRLSRRVLDRPRDRVRNERVQLAMVSGCTQVVIDWIERGMVDDPDALVDHLTGASVALMRHLEAEG
ncbi:TetR/AcrR family transcriptional regulator [Nocardiopsis sp. HNM0947]|uniref:TetR/AcrR family transcriptional regulator n=1 Tax=Nocardiopsis coralli TaxID=2772213 RepID=A0ABR9PAD2_9ACTN|nr:TetR/AcrR family transcriptional regulator [Nocardiopsis coralli]MBE3000782.1 TetR/AcrR family transcriptional regulator [Nocardiopsis coralli]